MKEQKWITQPLREAEEFRNLQYIRVTMTPKEWLLQRLLRRPLYFTDIASAAKKRGLSSEDVVKVLKELFAEGYKFCMIANPQGKRYVKTPMLIIRGTKKQPFFNCNNCPVPKETCKVWKEGKT